MTYRVAVVVPVFNTEAYLPRCLESLLNQSHQDFEIIVVDDCSAGDCKSIVDGFQGRKPRLKYVRHPENRGLLCSRFTGAEHSEGDYVGYLDSDDVALPNFLESLLTAANQTGADIVGSLRSGQRSSQFEVKGAEAFLRGMSDGVNYSVFTKLYRKSLILGLQDLRRLAELHRLETPEDLILNVFCALRDPTYVQVPLCLVDYTEDREDSLSNDMRSDAVRRNVKSRAMAYKLVRETAGGFGEEFIDLILKRSARFFYRKTLTRCSDEDLSWIRSYLQGSSEGHFLAALLVEVGALEGRSIARKLTEARDQKEKLRHQLKSEIERREALLGVLSQKLWWTGLPRLWSVWRSSRFAPGKQSAATRKE